MPSLDNWLKTDRDRVNFDAGRIVKRDEVELVIARGATDLPCQLVRIVPQSVGANERTESAANNTPSQTGVIVIGDTDLDIQKNDRFVFRSTSYKVVYVSSAMPGHVQAFAEGTQ